MITITNGIEEISIKENMTKKTKKGIIISPCRDYWYIELFAEVKKGKYTRIIKKLPPDSGDELKSYYNLDIYSEKGIVLSNEDYAEVKRLYENMQVVDIKRKESIILAAATLFAYECYQNYYLEELYKVPSEEMFEEIVVALQQYKELSTYKKEIYAMAKKILKEKYELENLLKD